MTGDRALTGVDVQLPLSADPDHFGVIQDALGREVMTVDVNAERPEEQVDEIVGLLVAAIDAGAAITTVPDAIEGAEDPMERIVLQHRAKAILGRLQLLNCGRANEDVLRDYLADRALDCGRKKFRAAVSLLLQERLVVVNESRTVRVVTLTEEGARRSAWKIGRPA